MHISIRLVAVTIESVYCYNQGQDVTATCYLATDLCLSWPKVLNLVTVRASLKTPDG